MGFNPSKALEVKFTPSASFRSLLSLCYYLVEYVVSPVTVALQDLTVLYVAVVSRHIRLEELLLPR